MATTPITGSTTTAATKDASSVFGTLDSQAFLKLLVAQIQYQNPMSPSDPTAMMGQLATYAQVEALNSMKTLQAGTNALSEASIASQMIGKQVTTTAEDGSKITGKVDAVRFTDAGPVLVLDSGAELSLSAVQRVDSTAAGAAAAPAATPVTPTTTPTPSVTPGDASTPGATTPTTPTTDPTTTDPTTNDPGASDVGAANAG